MRVCVRVWAQLYIENVRLGDKHRLDFIVSKFLRLTLSSDVTCRQPRRPKISSPEATLNGTLTDAATGHWPTMF